MISLRHRRVAWLIALLAVLSAGLIAHLSRQRFFALDAQVRHTVAVREAIATALSLVTDAETGQRGYLLTGDPAFLEPNQVARGKLTAKFAALRGLTGDNPSQQATARRLESLCASKLAELDETIDLRQKGKIESALAIVADGHGKRLMDDIRAETAQMLEREEATLEARRQAMRQAQSRTSLALLAGLGLAIALVLGGLSMVRRDMEEARLANQKTAERERVFRLLADNASDLIRILADDGSHLYVSPSSKRLLGYRAEELRAMSPESLLPEEERASFMPGQGDHTSRGTQSIVHRMRCKNGDYRWFETRIAPALYRPDGKPHMHLASRDITGRKQAEDELRQQKTLLQSIVTNMGDGLVVVDADRKFVMINPAIERYFSMKVGDVSPQGWSTETKVFLPDGVTIFPPEEGPLHRALKGEASDGVEMVMRHGTADERRFSVTARPIRDADGITNAVGVFHDITAQREAEHDLMESEQRWRVFSEASFEGVAVTRGGHILDTNATFAAWLGRDPSDLVGVEGMSVFAPEDRAYVSSLATSNPQGAYEARLQRPDGTILPVEVRGRSVVFRGQHVRIAVVRDITERRAQEAALARHAERLRELSLRDELTQLYNRRGFLELARHQLLLAARAPRPLTVFYADLNGMKAINDELGHEMGDRALGAVARVLSNVFRAADIVARLGGDEFAVLAVACDTEGAAIASARLRKLIDEFNQASGERFQLSVSLGASVYDPAAPVDLETLMQRADQQMYEVKRARLERAHERREGSRTATGG
jgi:diguanylate cyclase (GGDEF)-like protein/PAS domain S-box-containing protein